MIGSQVKYFCDEPEKIENYEEAVRSDKIWHCHHRLELNDDGTMRYTSRQLKKMGMYYHRPPEELIFLTPAAHRALHTGTDEFREFRREQMCKNWVEAKDEMVGGHRETDRRKHADLKEFHQTSYGTGKIEPVGRAAYMREYQRKYLQDPERRRRHLARVRDYYYRRKSHGRKKEAGEAAEKD